MTLKEIADFLGCALIGDAEITITSVASIESACAGEITFASEQKYVHRMEASAASAFIVTESLSKAVTGKNLIVSKNPYYSFAMLLNEFYKSEKRPAGLDKNVIIAKTASVSEEASIYPNVFIDEGAVIKDGVVIYPGCFVGENAVIGHDTLLYPNVVVREDCVVGDNVIVHSGSVIGSDGFGYVLHEGVQHKIKQVGKVIVEDDVEIGANVAIDRAALGETVIGKGTKIDNLVQIAHNVKTGKNCVIVGQVGISGSTILGDAVTLAGQVGVVGHIKIGNNVTATARAVLTRDINDNTIVSGYPAHDHADWLKSKSLTRKLPEMKKKIAELEKRVAELENKRDASPNKK